MTGIDRTSPTAHVDVNGVSALTDLEPDLTAQEAQPDVGQQRARQQPRLAQDLEAVADPEHRPAVARELDHRLHHRREARDRPRAQVVAVGEPARDDDRVDAAEVAVAVPQQLGRRTMRARARELGVQFIARSREADDPELHARICTS